MKIISKEKRLKIRNTLCTNLAITEFAGSHVKEIGVDKEGSDNLAKNRDLAADESSEGIDPVYSFMR